MTGRAEAKGATGKYWFGSGGGGGNENCGMKSCDGFFSDESVDGDESLLLLLLDV